MKYFRSFLAWRIKHIEEKHFVIFLSILIGISAAIAAVILKTLVHSLEAFVRNIAAVDIVNWLYFALPFMGILLTVIYIRTLVKDDISHGVTKILIAISRSKGFIKLHNVYSSVIACAITSGFGGSVGMEAPIAFTGSAIGSNIGRAFRLNSRKTTLMIGCGAAAAIAGIFKAPIAGLIFALEVLMLDLTLTSIIPLLIATVSATIVSTFLLGREIVFSFNDKLEFFYSKLHYYVLLGIVCGLVSLYFSYVNQYVEKRFSKIKKTYNKIIIGGLILGILIFFFPPLFGEGYMSLKALLEGKDISYLDNTLFYNFKDYKWVIVAFMLLVLLFKAFATTVTTGSGGVGGVFAPSLFMGGITGFIFARTVNLLGFIHLSEVNFILVGMAGVMAGVVHSPLTAIFLIAEITGGYTLFIPLILASAISYLTIIYFEPHSLYTRKLAQEGELITHHKDKAVLTLLKIESVIEKNLMSVKPEQTLGDLVKIIAISKRNIFPVIDEYNNFLGLITLDSVREIMFDKESYDTVRITDLMIQAPDYVTLSDNMDTVMEKFKDTGLWNLPVIDKGKYIGFVSRATVFNAYRKLLIEFSEE